MLALAEMDNTWVKRIFIQTNVQIKDSNLCFTSGGKQIVIPLETEVITHPVMGCVVKHMSSVVVLEPTVEEGRLALAHVILKRFASSLLWVLYYQTKAFRKKVLAQLDIGYEPLGKLYSAELDLYFACLDFWDSNDLSSVSDHTSALESWSELRSEDNCHHLNSPWKKGSKKDEEKAIQYMLDCLNSWHNPYFHLSEQLPHHFNLIESAIAIAKPLPTDNNNFRKVRREFREGAWNQYKEAWRGIKRALHNQPGLYRLHLDGEQLYAQTERNSRECIIFEFMPIYLQEFLPQIGG